MSWLEDFVQALLLRLHAHCISTPACKWGVQTLLKAGCLLRPPRSSLAWQASVGILRGLTPLLPGFSTPLVAQASRLRRILARFRLLLLLLRQASLASPRWARLPPHKTAEGELAFQIGAFFQGVRDCMRGLRSKLHEWLMQAKIPSKLHALVQGQEIEALPAEEVIQAR